MNFKRALKFSLLTYLVTFVIGIIASWGLNATKLNPTNIPMALWIIGLTSSALFAWIFALAYFRLPQIEKSLQNGFELGFIMVVVSFILDYMTTSFFVGNGQSTWSILSAYYSHYIYWITLVLVLAATSFAGWLKSKE